MLGILKMDLQSQVNDLQMKNAELMAQNLILSQQVSKMKKTQDNILYFYNRLDVRDVFNDLTGGTDDHIPDDIWREVKDAFMSHQQYDDEIHKQVVEILTEHVLIGNKKYTQCPTCELYKTCVEFKTNTSVETDVMVCEDCYNYYENEESETESDK